MNSSSSSSSSSSRVTLTNDLYQRHYTVAVLSSTLAIACSSYNDTQCKSLTSPAGTTRTNTTAIQPATTDEKATRVLTAKAFLELKRYKHAKNDAHRVLKNLNPHNRDAKSTAIDILQRDADRKRADRKLSKEV